MEDKISNEKQQRRPAVTEAGSKSTMHCVLPCLTPRPPEVILRSVIGPGSPRLGGKPKRKPRLQKRRGFAVDTTILKRLCWELKKSHITPPFSSRQVLRAFVRLFGLRPRLVYHIQGLKSSIPRHGWLLNGDSGASARHLRSCGGVIPAVGV